MTPLTQTLVQGVLILGIATFVPMIVRSARKLVAKQPMGDLGEEIKSIGREFMVNGVVTGSWFTRFAPVFIFATAILVALIAPTITTESVLVKLSDVAIVSTLIAAALGALALAVVDQGGKQHFAHVALVLVALLTAFAAAGSPGLAPRIFSIIAIMLVAGEMTRKFTVPYIGFFKVTTQIAFAMFGLTLGLVASHIAYSGFEPTTIVVKVLAIMAAFILIEEVTDRVKFTGTDRLILATASAVIAFLVAVAMHMYNLV